MNPLNRCILSLLFLVLCIPHLSFASNDDQEPTSYEAHLLSIKEYCTCLKGAASAEDFYRLYDMKTMSGEILQTASPDDQHPHFLYSVPDNVDTKSPMLGLTEINAMRCCNWIETSLPSSDNTPPNTEVGSYILHQDGSFEVNDAAQLHLVHHDDGTFEIISSVKKTASLLMMFEGTKRDGNKAKVVRPFPDVGSQTAANRREYDPVDDQEESSSQQNPSSPAMNIRVLSLANIVHNDNFDDDALIGYTGNARQEGSYIAIKDHLWCCPDILKACFRSQEDRDLMAQARQKIRSNLEESMKQSSNYKELVRTQAGNIMRFRRVDNAKITQDLRKFDQYFTDHNLTRGNLENFCKTYAITVSRPKTGLTVKNPIDIPSPSSMYGSVDSGTQALKGSYLGMQDEYESNERTPLTTSNDSLQTPVFKKSHVQEIHKLIETTRGQLTPGSNRQGSFDLFDMKAAKPGALTPTAKNLLAMIRGTSNLDDETRYNNWVYLSLVPKGQVTTFKGAIAFVQATLKKHNKLPIAD